MQTPLSRDSEAPKQGKAHCCQPPEPYKLKGGWDEQRRFGNQRKDERHRILVCRCSTTPGSEITACFMCIIKNLQIPREGKPLFKLSTIWKNNSWASSETGTQADWSWLRRAHGVQTDDTAQTPWLQNAVRFWVMEIKTERLLRRALSLLTPFPLFLQPTTVNLSSPPWGKTAHGTPAAIHGVLKSMIKIYFHLFNLSGEWDQEI